MLGVLEANVLNATQMPRAFSRNNSSTVTATADLVDLEALKGCFRLFQVIHALVISADDLKFVTESVIEDFISENVIYLELRSSPRKTERMTQRDYLLTVLAVLEEYNQRCHIQVRFLLSIDRAKGPVDAQRLLSIALELKLEHVNYGELIVGVDFSGNPTKQSLDEELYDFKDYLPVLIRARNAGLKVTLHCGEVPDPQEIEDMIRFRPERLGHCLCLSGTQFQALREQKTVNDVSHVIEVCPTSNCITLSMKSLHKHPVLEDHYSSKHGQQSTGYDILVCTDDKGIFRSTLSEELEMVQQAFCLSPKQVVELQWTAIKHCFANEKTKRYLSHQLRSWESAYQLEERGSLLSKL